MTDTNASLGSRVVPFAEPSLGLDDVDAVTRVLRSGWLTTGEETVMFESELAAAFGAEHAVAVSSCTAALEICLAYLRLDPGTLVAVPDWTFAATGLAVHRVGCVPLLIDVEPGTLNMSPASLRAALDEHAVGAVIPVHFAGALADPGIYELCVERRVPIVGDAAHAAGAHGSHGPLTALPSVAECLSFYATKNLTSGEGGAILTDDGECADFARSYRLHGLSKSAWGRYRTGNLASYDLLHPGIKANMPDLLAAIGRTQLAQFPSLQDRRDGLVARYLEHLNDIPGVRPLPTLGAEGNAHHLLVVQTMGDRGVDEVRAGLASAGVGSSVHFPPLSSYTWFKENARTGPTGTATATRSAGSTLSLPLYPAMTDEDVDYACRTLAAVAL